MQKEISGTIFIVRMQLISRNNDFSIDDFNVKVKFCSIEQEIDVTHFIRLILL